MVDAVADHLAALPSRPVWQPLPDDLRAALLELPLPERPIGLEALAGTMARDVLPHAMGNGHPAFFGWVNPPPAPAGVLASLPAAAMNPSVVSGDHADVHLERTAVRWLAELVGFPHAPGAGLLTSGGSAATIVCLAVRRGRAPPRPGTTCAARARGCARACSPTFRPRRTAACGARSSCSGSGAMPSGRCRSRRAGSTRRAARRDRGRSRGGRDCRRCSSARRAPSTPVRSTRSRRSPTSRPPRGSGSTSTAPTAPSASSTRRSRARYRGMERADSLTLDPHKWLGVPVDAGCALVRRADDLRDAFSLIPPYLRQDGDAAVGTFAEYGLEQTRPFRALKTWATIAARGRAGIAAQVARANALARELAALVEREPELELAAAPETSIVAFRARPAGCAPDRLEELNRALPEAVQARGRAFVTGTVFDGRETLARLHPAPRHDHGRPRHARRRGSRRRRRPGRSRPRRGPRRRAPAPPAARRRDLPRARDLLLSRGLRGRPRSPLRARPAPRAGSRGRSRPARGALRRAARRRPRAGRRVRTSGHRSHRRRVTGL